MDKKLRILLIEDNPGDARLIREMLRESSASCFELTHVHRVDEGLKCLREAAFDVLLLDLGLPESQGLDTFARVRTQAAAVPIVVLTGRSDEMLASEAVRNGAQDYLVKGEVEGSLLLRAIRYAVERKRAQEALRESEEKYRTLFEDSIEAISLTRLGKIVDVNPAWLALHSFEKKQEVVGLDVLDVIHPDDRKILLERRRAPVRQGERGYEIRDVRKDGSSVEVEIYSSAISINGEDAILTTVRDVSARKLAEKDLKESEEKFRTLVEQMADGVCIRNNGRIIFANESFRKMLGFKSEEEIVGVDYSGLISPECQGEDGGKRWIGENVSSRFETALRRKDGSTFDAEVVPRQMILNGGPVVQVVVRDITERKRLQEELIQTAKMAAVGTMISGIAHELNNPLAAISGYAHLLDVEESLSEAGRRDIARILSQTERCAHIVENLLRFARREKAEKRLTDLNEVLADTVDLRRYEMRVTDVDISEQYEPDLPMVFVNAHQLQQVFLNIISNAYDTIKERKERGKIAVCTRHVNNTILVEIEDDGGGIEHMDRIFEPFFTTKEVGKGTGLGLSVAYGIVQEHGGSIVAENTEEGARFTIRLPRVAGGSKEERKEEVEAPTPPSAGKRILIVDDEEDVGEVIRRALSKVGYHAETSCSPANALEKLKAASFDAVISDIVMPGKITARDLYEWIKDNVPELSTRVIFITGSSTGERTEDLLSGINLPVIRKPFDIGTLCQTVNGVMKSACTGGLNE